MCRRTGFARDETSLARAAWSIAKLQQFKALFGSSGMIPQLLLFWAWNGLIRLVH
jgi:hypothetical protein